MQQVIVNHAWGKNEIHDCPNYGESYSDKYFLVSLALAPMGSSWVFNADNAQEALDAAADYCEEMGYEGHFIADEDLPEYEKFDEVVYAGDHGRPLVSHAITILKVRKLEPIQEQDKV